MLYKYLTGREPGPEKEAFGWSVKKWIHITCIDHQTVVRERPVKCLEDNGLIDLNEGKKAKFSRYSPSKTWSFASIRDCKWWNGASQSTSISSERPVPYQQPGMLYWTS